MVHPEDDRSAGSALEHAALLRMAEFRGAILDLAKRRHVGVRTVRDACASLDRLLTAQIQRKTDASQAHRDANND